MVAHTHRSCAAFARSFDCDGRRIGRCTLRLHPFLMQKVYRNILVLVAGFCALQLLFHGKVFVTIALTVLLLSTISEKAAIFIDKWWFWFGEKAGKVNAAILLFLIYYLILTPIAFLSRIGKKDPLQLHAPEKSNFIVKHHRYSAKDLENPW
jgi:hypothetical protein